MTIKEFTIEVTGFPNEAIHVHEIEDFFNKICASRKLMPVSNVTLAYKFKNSLENIIKVSEYHLKIQEYKIQIERSNLNKRKLIQIAKKIDNLKKRAIKENKAAKKKLGLLPEEIIDYKNMQDNKILKAFVSFEDTETTDTIRNEITNVTFFTITVYNETNC